MDPQTAPQDGLPRIEWIICRYDRDASGTHLQELLSLSESEHSEMRAMVDGLNSAGTSIAFLTLVDAWHAFCGVMDALGRLAKMPTVDVEVRLSRSHILRRVTSALLNYLAAARMYEDSTRAALSARAGNPSEELEEFNADASRAFDASPGYRFTYHFRNAFQHTGGLPLSLSFDPETSKAEIVANRDEFLKARQWHRAVRSDLEMQPAVFAVRPLMAESFSEYVMLEHARAERDFSACLGAAKALSGRLRSWALPPDMSPIILTLVHDSETGATMRPLECPSIEWIEGFIRAVEDRDPLGYLLRPGELSESVYTSSVGEREVGIAALDLLEVWHGLGPDGVAREVKEVIQRGPQPSADAILGLINIAAATIIEIEMLLGGSVGGHLRNLREIVEGR